MVYSSRPPIVLRSILANLRALLIRSKSGAQSDCHPIESSAVTAKWPHPACIPPGILLISTRSAIYNSSLPHASLLFQAICERYEKQQAIVLTSNKAFADWGQIFAGDAIGLGGARPAPASIHRDQTSAAKLEGGNFK